MLMDSSCYIASWRHQCFHCKRLQPKPEKSPLADGPAGPRPCDASNLSGYWWSPGHKATMCHGRDAWNLHRFDGDGGLTKPPVCPTLDMWSCHIFFHLTTSCHVYIAKVWELAIQKGDIFSQHLFCFDGRFVKGKIAGVFTSLPRKLLQNLARASTSQIWQNIGGETGELKAENPKKPRNQSHPFRANGRIFYSQKFGVYMFFFFFFRYLMIFFLGGTCIFQTTVPYQMLGFMSWPLERGVWRGNFCWL